MSSPARLRDFLNSKRRTKVAKKRCHQRPERGQRKWLMDAYKPVSFNDSILGEWFLTKEDLLMLHLPIWWHSRHKRKRRGSAVKNLIETEIEKLILFLFYYYTMKLGNDYAMCGQTSFSAQLDSRDSFQD